MRIPKFKLLLGPFFLIIAINGSYAQNIVQRELKWEQLEITNPDEKSTRKLESFQGANFDTRFKDLSLYTEKFQGSYSDFKIINTVYEPLNQNISLEILSKLSESPLVESYPAMEKKKEQTLISILPYRKNSIGKVEKLVSFSLSYNQSFQNKNSAVKPRTYASNSVLKDGDWYKIAVGNSGMYRLTYDDLSRMGIAVDQVNPKNIRIYGNSTPILPESNAIFRHDDLQENAILVIGEEDGIFNKEDYILFYATGPNPLVNDVANKLIQYTSNPYTKESYYFLNFDKGLGKRMSIQNNSVSTATDIVNDYNYFDVHEKNTSTGVNATIKSGRERYGEEFNNITSYDFKFNIPDVVTTKPIKMRTDLIGRAQKPSTSSFIIKNNGQVVSNLFCEGVHFTYDYDYGSIVSTGYLSLAPSENLNINITYNKPDITAIGYLNFIHINAYRQLKLIGNQTTFRNFDTYGTNKVSQFNFVTSDVNNTKILDISDRTNPKIQQVTINNNTLTFTLNTDVLREFHAYSGNSFSPPRYAGRIENQNLHSLGQYDFIIISNPEFISEAERLANFRKTNNNLRTLVVKPEHIYNEFSSGAQDASAIRDFMKMFYDRAGNNEAEMPKYLLIFGDGSYDNVGYVNPNTNYVVTFESRNSISPFNSYVTDDFFGLLDDIEGDWDFNQGAKYGAVALDVAVGRLPVQSSLQARQMVDKILHYSKTETFGDWRNRYVLIADDQDDNLHLIHAESHAKIIKSRNKNFNIDKIYLDTYQQMSTPAGNRYPEVNSAFNQRVNSGALVINYIGHGGENGLAHEKILTIEDINSWKGLDNMPVLLTATCSFTRWDDPLFQSAGELCLLNPNGGAIALFTTTRIVYAHENKAINESFIKALFDSTNVGGTNTLGDIYRTSKNFNGLGLSPNQRNFTLLGDPSLPFATPKYKVVTESINDIPFNSGNADTIKALSTINLKGYITDKNGNLLSNYNGIVYPAVYDKKASQKTLGQDRESPVTSYEVQKNVIYKGKASVVNGRFSFSFVVPKDISYNVGYGRLSYYAQLGTADANGAFDSVLVGGSSNVNLNDVQGPQMKIFLNDENFANGGITGDRPVLIVKLNDQNGINTVGNGIGHNITANLISSNGTQKIDLNEYYESTLDSYQEGEIRYPFAKLAPGNYKLSVKAWDVVNNSSEISTEFSVVESGKFSIDKVYNYPNPFTTNTGFQFEHNRPGDQLKVMVQIFSVSGKLIKTINQDVLGNGSRVSNIAWDAKDEYGDKLARGVYVYRLKVKASDGSLADKYQKLVIF